MALYLARHGQAIWKQIRRWQSRTDVPLNDTGRQQTRPLSQLIKGWDIFFEPVVCSPLKRVRETGKEFMDGHDPEVESDSKLVELEKELGTKYANGSFGFISTQCFAVRVFRVLPAVWS